MSISEFLKSTILIVICVFLARFIMPPSYTPIVAMAVFLPFMTEHKSLQMLLPVSILFFSDLILGFYGQTMIYVYGTMILIGLLSRVLHKGTAGSLLLSGFSSVLLWHLIVNFGVYINGLGTLSLAQTYLLAIPFDLKLLISTVAFSLVFYTGWLITQKSFLASTRN
jgi:hypothetical protein